MPYRVADFSDVTTRNLSSLKILNAMYDLLEERDFSRITVTDICSRSGVSRKTFYRHFQSKYDVLNRLGLEVMAVYENQLGRELTWHEWLEKSMAALEPYFPMLLHTDKSAGYESPKNVAMRNRIKVLYGILENTLGIEVDEELRWEMRFYAAGGVDVIWRYVAETTDPKGADLAAILEACIPARLKDIIDESALSRKTGDNDA